MPSTFAQDTLEVLESSGNNAGNVSSSQIRNENMVVASDYAAGPPEEENGIALESDAHNENDSDVSSRACPEESDSSGEAQSSLDADNESDVHHEDNADSYEETTATNGRAESNEFASRIQEFLANHSRWRDHVTILENETGGSECRPEGRPALYAAMSASSDAKVMMHALKTEVMNGRVGSLVRYLAAMDRFVVAADGKEMAVRACNIRLIDNKDDIGEEDGVTAEKLESVLFRPGMQFLGTIQIPGLPQQGRQEYRLIIDSDPISDESGRLTGILARHRAYDDEQFVWIHVERNESETVLSIQYADGETQCHGTWNAQKAQFEGTVRQLLPTEDGSSIYYTRDEVTHAFVLSPTTAQHPKGIATSLETTEETNCDENDNVELQANWENDVLSPATTAIAEHRSKTDKLCLELVGQFRELSEGVDCWRRLIMDRSKEDERKWIWRLGDVVAWSDLLAADTLAAEKTCANLRRRAELLDSLLFASPEERTGTLADLKEKAISRSLAHSESDEWKQAARSIINAAGITSTTFNFPNFPGNSGIARYLSMCGRLEQNFARFDGALRRAEKRLTEADICRWIVALPSGSRSRTSSGDDAESDEILCAICRVDLKEDVNGDENDYAEILCLPCSHSFHDECLREWLRHHALCPVCRFRLQQQPDE